MSALPQNAIGLTADEASIWADALIAQSFSVEELRHNLADALLVAAGKGAQAGIAERSRRPTPTTAGDSR